MSGQLPLRPGSNEVVDGAIADQTRQALSNALAVVREAGLDLGDVAKATIFVTDLAAYAEVNAVYESFFQTWRPARSVVEVSRLPRDARVEIELIAARHQDEVRRFEGAR